MNLKIIAKSPIAHGAFTEGIGNGNIDRIPQDTGHVQGEEDRHSYN